MAGANKIYPPQKYLNIYLSFLRAKIGVIGLNGSGKSSHKDHCRPDKFYQGEVVFSPGYSVGYLAQAELDHSKTVREVAEEGS